MQKKRSFFERLTGGVHFREDDDDSFEEESRELKPRSVSEIGKPKDWMEEETEEGQLTVDVYQTPTDIVVQAMVTGVRPEDLSINITRDMITIKGKREENRSINEENYFAKELYWGTFSRTILLPQEIEPEDAEAIEKHGLLIVKLPKIDKEKKATIRVKSI